DMKTDFINNMTHELKTPIATISIASEMLKDNSISESKENRAKYAGIIFDENKRLYNHVEQVLQIARLEKGELQLNIEDRDIHEIIQASAKRFHLILEELNGKIELHLNAENHIFKLDEMHFTAAINNLIDNAIKYNDKPNPTVEIGYIQPDESGTIEPDAEMVSIYIKDNGIGIKEKHYDTIFRIFKRLHARDKFGGGTGAGLTIVQKIIERHGGKIWLNSEINEGTTFYFTLSENKNEAKNTPDINR
ncbi:MAG: HAMP domain-containing histidine kinase, partial [Calditrichaeota bacterium]|nr:HAMP domain-containing histidine kinase [Calditrichota bacterium]